MSAPGGAERDVHGGKLPQTKAGEGGVCVLGRGVLVMIEPKPRRPRGADYGGSYGDSTRYSKKASRM